MYNRVMIELQRCTNQDIWDDYVLENGGHPLQLWGWGQLKAAHGWSVDRLLVYKDEGIVGASQILTRKLPSPLRAFSYVPRGPVAGQEGRGELLDSLADYVKREYHAVALSVEPDTTEFAAPHGWVASRNTILMARTIILDLKKTESELLNDMVKKTRQYIRKSAAEAITIRQVRSREELAKCLEVYRQTSERAQFDIHDDQYYYDVFNILGDHSPVFAAYVDNQPIAFLWLAISADTAFELYGGVTDLGQELRANYALKWHAILKSREWGLTRYDFNGQLNDGVSNFKKGWTTEEIELAGTFDKPLSAFYSVWSSGLPTAKIVVRKIKSLRK
ncbi:peptidoglycan bridge formation glycyltransferase FemA/FemB family protein [Candidatus Saccharibacteria bacterium]|nr:peptidoglycan bridge formation glycyltransferase FemA/FemB family protein [Candidatus Saccharibacteria bacterium]